MLYIIFLTLTLYTVWGFSKWFRRERAGTTMICNKARTQRYMNVTWLLFILAMLVEIANT